MLTLLKYLFIELSFFKNPSNIKLEFPSLPKNSFLSYKYSLPKTLSQLFLSVQGQRHQRNKSFFLLSQSFSFSLIERTSFNSPMHALAVRLL
ncbi:hypothetical protein A946_03475 [Methylacidiphilum kamchatkense Kam1]|uniref:Uncharacterized protein n=1 Tax=Methylacidiphilum kamchatkense Kam1 TaxID=1202785 RepID=A0ABR4ZZG3_9BACT|nr:hypothetical protein A946_03475 [Methylacidiphilum kamchatkense Kam1]